MLICFIRIRVIFFLFYKHFDCNSPLFISIEQICITRQENLSILAFSNFFFHLVAPVPQHVLLVDAVADGRIHLWAQITQRWKWTQRRWFLFLYILQICIWPFIMNLTHALYWTLIVQNTISAWFAVQSAGAFLIFFLKCQLHFLVLQIVDIDAFFGLRLSMQHFHLFYWKNN